MCLLGNHIAFITVYSKVILIDNNEFICQPNRIKYIYFPIKMVFNILNNVNIEFRLNVFSVRV